MLISLVEGKKKDVLAITKECQEIVSRLDGPMRPPESGVEPIQLPNGYPEITARIANITDPCRKIVPYNIDLVTSFHRHFDVGEFKKELEYVCNLSFIIIKLI